MFVNFTNPGAFANIFLLNFHVLVLAQRLKFSRLKHSAVIALELSRLLLAFQMSAGLKFSRRNHARVEYSKLLKNARKNDTIQQLQMGVSTIATALVHTAL